MPKQILLVDDSVTVHRIVEITFAQEDVALTIAKSADEGIERAKQLKPDLVLIDAGLAGKSGYDVVAALRGEGLSKTACLLLTSNFSPYDEAKGGQVGADGFVVKPSETQVLIDKSKEAMSKRASGDASAPAPVAAAPRPAAVPVAAAPRPGVESLGKPLSTVAAETSARIPTPAAMPAPLRPPGATNTPPVAGATPDRPRPQPKATLMGIAAVNPNMIPGATPPPAAPPPVAAKPAPAPAPVAKAAPPPVAVAPPPAVQAEATPKPAPLPERPAPAAKAPEPVRPVAAEAVRPTPAPAPAAAAAPSAIPHNVPQMPRPSLVPGVATPVAKAAPIAAMHQNAMKTPPRGEPAGSVSSAMRDAAERVVQAVPAAIAAKGPEYEALAKLSREVIEQVVWEVVPELAESIIRQELDRLVRERQNA